MTDDDCAVRIAVRERPLREIYKNNDIASVIDYHSSNSNILVVDERPFAFDHVLPRNISQRELFDFLVMPLVDKVLEGFNCTALAYGQTGTGKSFTMGLNPESLEGENVGMIPRCIAALLDKSNDSENHSMKIGMQVSFIEIYNEKGYDLLSENVAEPIVARGCKFTGGTKIPIIDILDAYELLNQGTKNRHVRPTKMNPQSSRSHAIFTLHVQIETANKVTASCLNLVDLAGSEGVRRTGHQGVALSEGVNINQGLLSIGKVLQALTLGYKAIPYRESVLSTVLQDSLNPNSYFTLLACISPHREDLSETLSTLRFAQSAKNLKHNPHINLKLMDYKRSKTPYKMNSTRNNQLLKTPTPYKRPFSMVTNKQSVGPKKSVYHGNTFCTTPSKKKCEDVAKFNRTDIGLTPKEKQKIGSVQMPSLCKPTESSLDRYEDTSLESRGSLLSLNISTSTAIDAQPTKPSNVSPIVRKCMAAMENTMKESMYKVLETMKGKHCPDKNSPIQCEPVSSNLVEETIRRIIRQELMTIGEQTTNNGYKQVDKIVRCELFRESTPTFKMPNIPLPETRTTLNSEHKMLSEQNESIMSVDETILSQPLRRSRRIPSMINNSNADSSYNISKSRGKLYSTIKTLNDNRRRSIRLVIKKEHCKKNCEELGVASSQSLQLSASPQARKESKARKKKQSSCPVNNTVIAGYFEGENESKPKNVKTVLAKHQKAILEMLNTASMKELQYLPQIGLKTAFQIVTQRTLHGKFKNFTQVGKLPIWRGRAWERFKEANNITEDRTNK